MATLKSMFARLPAPLRSSLSERLTPRLLPEGETAPEWHLQSWDNTWHRHGKSWSVLVFYPEDGGDADRAQLDAFQAHLSDFTRLGVKVYGINPAEAASHEAFARTLGLGFPLLTDRGGSVGRQFRASMQLLMRPLYIRTVYLVNPERKIRLGNRGNPSVAAIVRSVEALQAAKAGM